MKSAKSLGFRLGQEKVKQNKKLLLRAWRNRNCFSAPALLIARALATIMKKILTALIVLSGLTSCGQDLNCTDFKNGTFMTPGDSIFPYQGTILRKDGKQIEWSTESTDTTYINIKYLDDCNYVLTYDSELNVLDELDKLINDSGGMQVEVLEIKGDTLFYNGVLQNDTLRFEKPGTMIKLTEK